MNIAFIRWSGVSWVSVFTEVLRKSCWRLSIYLFIWLFIICFKGRWLPIIPCFLRPCDTKPCPRTHLSPAHLINALSSLFHPLSWYALERSILFPFSTLDSLKEGEPWNFGNKLFYYFSLLLTWKHFLTATAFSWFLPLMSFLRFLASLFLLFEEIQSTVR